MLLLFGIVLFTFSSPDDGIAWYWWVVAWFAIPAALLGLGMGVLHILFTFDDYKEKRKSLKQKLGEYNAQDDNGKSSIHFTAFSGNCEQVEAL